MLQLQLMNINRDTRIPKMLQTTSMIEMQMTHNNSLDILDVITSLGNGNIKLIVFLVIDPGEDIIQWWSPYFRVVFACTGFIKNQTFLRVRDEY